MDVCHRFFKYMEGTVILCTGRKDVIKTFYKQQNYSRCCINLVQSLTQCVKALAHWLELSSFKVRGIFSCDSSFYSQSI